MCTVSRHTFHRHLIATSMDQQHMCVILRNVEQLLLFRLLFQPAWCPLVLGWPLNDPIFPWQADSRLWFTTWLPDEFGRGFNCVTCGGENVPMDAIWLLLVKTYPLPTTLWLPAHLTLPPLVTPVKCLSKMVGNSASYPVYSRHNELPWIAIDLCWNTCKQLYSFSRYNISKLYFWIFIIAHIYCWMCKNNVPQNKYHANFIDLLLASYTA